MSAVASGVSPDTGNETPFPGLRPFAGRDHRFFFGRQQQTFALYRLLRNHRFVSVVGSSGSGKSSIVQAGLLPLLEQESTQSSGIAWHCATMRPGRDPIEHLALTLAGLRGERDDPLFEPRCDRIRAALQSSSLGITETVAHALPDPNAQLVLLVDQFEELFRYLSSGQLQDIHELARKREEATKFVQLLLRATRSIDSRVRVLITMRSDFIGECSRFQGLPEAVSEAQFLVPALSRDQREETIRGPVKLAGGTIAPELVERLLNDSNDELDQLPVLQHCLARLWSRAGASDPAKTTNDAAPVSPEAPAGRILTEAHYRDIGGMAAALSTHADEIFAQLAGHEKAIELIFRSLAEVDKEGRAIRRACPFAQLVAETGAPRDDVRVILEKFRADDCSFVVPSASELSSAQLADDTVIDVGHEALLRRWTRVSGDPEATGERADKRDIGWLRQEKSDGERYQFLRSCVNPDSPNEARLSDDQIRRYWNWWLDRKPNVTWAARYGGHFADVEQLINRSHEGQTKARRTRVAWSSVAAILVLLLGGTWIYLDNKQRRKDEAFRTTVTKISAIVLDEFNSGNLTLETATKFQEITDELGRTFDNLPDSQEFADLKVPWLLMSSDLSIGMNNKQDAKEDAEHASALARSFLRKNPDNPKWQSWLYGSLFRMGDIDLDDAALRSDSAALERALSQYQESRKIAEGLLSREMASAGFKLAAIDQLAKRRFDVAFAINKVGEAFQVKGDLPRALALYQEALGTATMIEGASRIEFQLQSATTRIKIAVAQGKMGETDQAIATYSAAIEREEQLYAANPAVKTVRSNLASAYEQRSLLFRKQKNFDRAQQDLSHATRIYRQLNNEDPREVSALQRLIRVYSRMYTLLEERAGDADADLDNRVGVLRTEIELREKLVAQHPGDASFRDGLKGSQDRLNELAAKFPAAKKE